ncbi:hypothetical protein [Puniceicoccus vermicola]|uniref:DUF4397 domain-containing protein n=1 Tax=Puniceicoccus vermicola TaxID=388746 RepID=A0A7X1B1C5_9BACT|nr:hypothetical protein [Puniceicoccus vermicola]MBC2603809.1 hypothetical protein [Puniceicoccus vermicola]
MTRPIFFLLVLLVTGGPLAIPSLNAQSDEVRNFKFTTMSWSRYIGDLFYRNVDGEEFSLRIPNGAPSIANEYRGTFPIRFYRVLGQDDLGNPIEQTAAVFRPTSGEEQLLIFVENPSDDSVSYRIFPVPFSRDGAERNQYRFINLSEYPVYVKFGEERFKISPRDENTIQTDIPESGGQRIAMAIQVSEKPDDLKVAYSSSWSVRSGRSALVFITKELDDDDRIDVKQVYY